MPRTVRRIVVGMLESLGYQVRQAEDGRAALEILERPGKIDLLFTDMMMPHGMTGQDLFAQARERRPDLKVLFTSGHSQHFIDTRRRPSRAASQPSRTARTSSPLAVRDLLDGAAPRPDLHVPTMAARAAICATIGARSPRADRWRSPMRVFLAAVAIALLTVPAFPQGMTKGKQHHPPEQKADPNKKKADDKAYNDALSRIKAPDVKPDPWKNVR